MKRPGHHRLMTGMTAIALAATAVVSAPAAAQAAPLPAPDTCSLASASFTATQSVDTQRTAAFTAYANSGDGGDGWSGADSTYSVKLPGGRLAWVFSDTFLGPVAADGTRPESSPFINNSIVIERATGDLSTVHGGTSQAPQALVPPPDDSHWYWFGAAVSDPSGGSMSVVALEFQKFGPGIWDWGWDSNHLATFDTTTWKLTSLVDLPSSAGVQWSAWIEQVGADRYVYGVEDLGLDKYLHIAKVTGGDLADPAAWSYWTGTGWSSKESDSVRVMNGVANEHSVARFRDGYLMVTQDTRELFSNKIVGYVSCSPVGPFREIGTLATMPEVGPNGSYHDGNIFAYNAHEHPELRKGSTLEITYNVNSFDNTQLYRDASIYRPRFLTVQLQVTPTG